MDNMAAALMFRYRPLSSMFRIWRRKKEEPVYVEDGVEYYLSRATKRAIRQADRMMKRMSKLHRARPYNRPGNGHVHVVMETTRFRKNVKLMRRQGADIAVLETAIDILASGQELPPSFDDHHIQLKRQRNRVCRIGPDWLLIYRLEDDDLILVDVGLPPVRAPTASGSPEDKEAGILHAAASRCIRPPQDSPTYLN